MPSQGHKRLGEESSDSEWDYEYHETEIESFFVTVALSSVPVTRPKKKPKKAESQTADITTPSTTIDASSQTPNRLDAEDVLSEGDTAPASPTGTPRPEDRIQILDLHSREPIVSFQSQIYTCEWTSTLGTDILCAAPDPSPSVPPLYEAPGFHILATPTIKLVGRPVDLVRRLDSFAVPNSPPSAPPPVSLPVAANTTSLPPSIAQSTTAPNFAFEFPTNPASRPPPSPARLPVPVTSSLVRQNQGRFLERLSAAKVAKGEQDSVLLSSRRRPPGKGWKTWEKRSRDYGTGEEARAFREGGHVQFESHDGEGVGNQGECAGSGATVGEVLSENAIQAAHVKLPEKSVDTTKDVDVMDESVKAREDPAMIGAPL